MIGFFEIEQINLKYCRSRPIFKKTKTTATIKTRNKFELFLRGSFLIGVVRIVLIPYHAAW